MKAVCYDFTIPKYLAARLLGNRFPRIHTSRLSAVSFKEVPDPRLRGPEWVLVEPRLSGICGTDMGTITAKSSPALAPYVSFPSVMGHEVVADVIEVGEAVDHCQPGDRVVIDPFISCYVRGLEPCPSCARGLTARCERAAGDESGDQLQAPGMILGFCRELPGAWAERMVVHRSQVFQVPDALSDEVAVLVEPLAVCVHAALKRLPAPGDRVLVLGGGTIGLCMVAALRLLDLDVQIAVSVRYDFQKELALTLGADAAFTGRDAAVQAAKAMTTVKAHRPPIGPQVYMGGFDVVYDCVGSSSSVDDALRLTRSGGSIVLVGGAGELPKIDWTFVWTQELTVTGTIGYGIETWEGRRVHTFYLTMERLLARPDLPLGRMITHRFSLDEYREALRVNLGRSRAKAIKTVFQRRPKPNVVQTVEKIAEPHKENLSDLPQQAQGAS